MIDPTPTKVIYVHAHEQPTGFPSFVEFRRDIQQEDLTVEKLNNQPSLLILDDVFINLPDRFIYQLYTNISHHCNLSVITILQHLFMKTRVMRQVGKHMTRERELQAYCCCCH